MTVSRDAVSAVPLFASLSKRELKEVASTMHEYSYPAGKELMTEGQEGVGFFLIAEGEAMVTGRGSEKRLHAGDWFGEMALIDGGTRTASVQAVTDMRCFTMTSWEFRPLVQAHPAIAWAVMETLVRRVREFEATQET